MSSIQNIFGGNPPVRMPTTTTELLTLATEALTANGGKGTYLAYLHKIRLAVMLLNTIVKEPPETLLAQVHYQVLQKCTNVIFDLAIEDSRKIDLLGPKHGFSTWGDIKATARKYLQAVAKLQVQQTVTKKAAHRDVT